MTDTTDRTHRLLADILRRANGGSDPALIKLAVGRSILPADAEEIGDRRQRLHVTADSSGRLIAALGIATHFKMLWSHDLAFCLAPSGLIFLQSFQTPLIYAWVEDGQFLLDRGSPLPTVTQRLQAMATFDADFVNLLAEMA
ncbi:hypothetical protein HZF05_07340 [Sphingomonas sp. CGMCC 1.13654]|uniref:Uncharacterized protein n=1 Tax=Sphingomonas chungangi TaxID=2683589 RepID=A0A838L344_9SPHN|nr:hypothetical protein [Sphingomonas chungangi]MBA2933913.1 hypothetical protein [Sphingomonas chungangi]MVW55242.1 hypothetical protein [Sphingomonas chungangi]